MPGVITGAGVSLRIIVFVVPAMLKLKAPAGMLLDEYLNSKSPLGAAVIFEDAVVVGCTEDEPSAASPSILTLYVPDGTLPWDTLAVPFDASVLFVHQSSILILTFKFFTFMAVAANLFYRDRI